jgi:hypothetical protein
LTLVFTTVIATFIIFFIREIKKKSYLSLCSPIQGDLHAWVINKRERERESEEKGVKVGSAVIIMS